MNSPVRITVDPAEIDPYVSSGEDPGPRGKKVKNAREIEQLVRCPVCSYPLVLRHVEHFPSFYCDCKKPPSRK